tara:strand:- start:6020 stop:6319 length:300 start_codon:yes stop_codon:yes gene_type:complete
MKRIIAIAALTGFSATLAFADVRVDEAAQLQQDGKIKPFSALNEIAMKEYPDAKITDTELEDSYGKYVYQVELRDAAGKEWDVDIDAATGEVLRSQQDD